MDDKDPYAPSHDTVYNDYGKVNNIEPPPSYPQKEWTIMKQKPDLPNRIIMILFSVFFFIAATIVIIIEIVTLASRQVPESYGDGLWTGLVWLTAAIINLFLSAIKSNALSLTCLIIDSISLAVCVIGGVFGYFGRNWVLGVSGNTIFVQSRPEQIGVLVMCIITGCVFIAHLVILLRASCTCCKKSNN